MNILLVSECSGRALIQTRRILDQFAERRGERTWQTPMTRDGLDTLRRLLRKTARKNTAVACHWIRGLNHSELLWVVGDAARFNAQGAVPTNSTRRDVLRKGDENDWHTGEDISLLMQMAALLHDLGKASISFQERLASRTFERNLYRHEWLSLRLFLAFVGEDDDTTWLQRLAEPAAKDDATWLDKTRLFRDGLDAGHRPPFKGLPPLAAAIAWLVVTHHRLLTLPVHKEMKSPWFGMKSPNFNPVDLQPEQLWNRINDGWNDWNPARENESPEKLESYWRMAGDLPVLLPTWRARASKLAKKLLALQAKAGKGAWLENPYVMHIARMGLMLADHHYSSLKPNDARRVAGDEACTLYANTDAGGKLKQKLDEHLLGVAQAAGSLAFSLPSFAEQLPHLQHRALRKRSKDARFRWQDKAFDAAEGLRYKANEHGAFIVNMASTGRGKTLANARIMAALSDPQRGMRCSFAVGLRSLTLQTGRSFQKDLGLADDDLAIRVGGAASRELFEYHEKQAERSGSASTQALMEEDSSVIYEGDMARHPLLRMALHDARIKSLLSAPVLVCTIDHLTPATEAQRAGRQIAPMLRLMSSDLVLDEPDDFDLDDIPALVRLVHWAGLLGSRVLLSSATLPPDLVQGLYQAYAAGRAHYQRNRGQHGGQPITPDVACLWVDEYGVEAASCSALAQFQTQHRAFIEKRIKALGREAPKRRGELLPLNITAKTKPEIRKAFAAQVQAAMLQAHQRHAQTDAVSGKQVSFGLVRMANIDPLQDVARELFRLEVPADTHIHLCVYHARFPLLLRSEIERVLDLVLDRRGETDPVLSRPEIRALLQRFPARNHLFVVLASPVAEVGRDHDYDWAVVEPSSMRSLIQLAGRVRRHRGEEPDSPNMLIFERNLRSFEKPGKAAFIRPGFEEDAASGDRPKPLRLRDNSLQVLLPNEQYQTIDARPRIQRPADLNALQWQARLVDLEHARMYLALRTDKPQVPTASTFWTSPLAHLTWALPQQQPFRESSYKEQAFVFLPDEDEARLCAHFLLKDGQNHLYSPAGDEVKPLQFEIAQGISPWIELDLLGLVGAMAEEKSMSLQEAAKRYTEIKAPRQSGINQWRWHPVLGMRTSSAE
ncbi:type I-F CRISPR-associated helicase Cas3 [Lysobacteraceae bacterium NML120232]|nr:type I-F CRISPR-associated helicase Cas3 [Xanthomonadaceae bacterium NML120232]